MKRNRLSDAHGFTLVEMLVALTLASVFAGSLFFTMRALLRGAGEENVRIELQQNVRSGMELMLMDIRMAGLNPLEGANIGFETATASKVRFTQDNSLNGTIENADFEKITYEYEAETDPNDNDFPGRINQILYEGGGTGVESSATIMTKVSAFTLTYLNEQGQTTTSASDIRNVRVEVTVQERSVADPTQTVERTLRGQVACRNL